VRVTRIGSNNDSSGKASLSLVGSGGRGDSAVTSTAGKARQSDSSLRSPGKSDEALTVAVTDFLAELCLSRSERVLGALALALAEGMDASPPYAKGKLARELREVLTRLEQAEMSPANLSLLQGRTVSETADEHIAKAFASLADVSKRELEATADALPRKHSLHDFAGVFREVAYTRGAGSDPHLARFHVREFVARADDDLVARLGGAEAPFWRHVRDAILACREEVESHR
jgi:hypothetical protein